jgi:Protein of unknown function (DUF2934)
MHSEHRSVRELAYQLWKARGCPDGTAEQDWQEAERQLAEPKTQSASKTQAAPKTQAAKSAAVDASLKDSFPASDPPATQGPDEPPANAAAKWKAAGVSRKKSIRRSTPASSK